MITYKQKEFSYNIETCISHFFGELFKLAEFPEILGNIDDYNHWLRRKLWGEYMKRFLEIDKNLRPIDLFTPIATPEESKYTKKKLQPPYFDIATKSVEWSREFGTSGRYDKAIFNNPKFKNNLEDIKNNFRIFLRYVALTLTKQFDPDKNSIWESEKEKILFNSPGAKMSGEEAIRIIEKALLTYHNDVGHYQTFSSLKGKTYSILGEKIRSFSDGTWEWGEKKSRSLEELVWWILKEVYPKNHEVLGIAKKLYPSRFHCTECGECCRHISNLLPEFDTGDGVCCHLDGSGRCDIYETRPLECRVDDFWERCLRGKMSKEDWYDLNYQGCSKLQSPT